MRQRHRIITVATIIRHLIAVAAVVQQHFISIHHYREYFETSDGVSIVVEL